MSYVRIAELAAEYARGKLIYGASNVQGATGFTGARVSEARSFLLDGSPRGFNVAYILRVAQGAIFSGAGNCGEFAAVAFSYLYRRQILPLDYVSYTVHDHAWIVIGRPAGTDVRRPEEWGDSPVICDPWVGLEGDEMVTTMDDYDDRYDTWHVESKVRVEKTRSTESPFN